MYETKNRNFPLTPHLHQYTRDRTAAAISAGCRSPAPTGSTATSVSSQREVAPPSPPSRPCLLRPHRPPPPLLAPAVSSSSPRSLQGEADSGHSPSSCYDAPPRQTPYPTVTHHHRRHLTHSTQCSEGLCRCTRATAAPSLNSVSVSSGEAVALLLLLLLLLLACLLPW